MLSMIQNVPRSLWVYSTLYGLLLFGAYYDSLKWLIEWDWAREDYSHCYLIPFAVLYLIWEKRSVLAATPARPTWLGLIPMVLAFTLFWLGELGGEFFLIYLSLWLNIVGLCWIHMGWSKLRVIGFPLLLLLTMFPPPHFVNNQITVKMKLYSSQLGVMMLQAWGMSAYREGNVIDIGYTQLQVVDACSGLRYLIPLMVLGLIVAYWFKAPLWRRVLLFASTIPLSIVVNALRIAATGVLYAHWGAEVAEGFFHGFSGWLIFMLTTAILWLEMLLLRRFPTRYVEPAGDGPAQAAEGPPSDASGMGGSHQPSRFRWQPASIAAILLLVGTVALSHGVDFREKIPIQKSFELFPLTVDEWAGTRRELEQKYVDTLDFSAYLLIDYLDDKGKAVNLYTAYYESQSKGESIHSPSTCLPGSGYAFHESGEAEFPLGDGNHGTLRVNRAFMQKDRTKQLVYYWFPMRGRNLTQALDLKLYTFWDALTRQRTDGALVRLVTPVYESEDLEQADARLQAFAGRIVPVLNEYIPGN